MARRLRKKRVFERAPVAISTEDSMSGITRWTPVTLIRALGLLLLLALIPTIQGCDDGTGPEMTQVKIQLTDAPSDYIERADVWISRVYLQGCADGEEGEEAECEAEDLFNAADEAKDPLEFNLLDFRNGATTDLTEMVNVPARVYRQLRLVVDSAKVTLIDDYEFENPVMDPDFPDALNVAVLKVPSGAQSGIKVHLTEPINGDSEEVTVILVDFDVDANFVLQGPEQGMTFKGMTFTPTLNEKGRSHQGEG
jgi:hypothetical protein